jgi:formate-dependent nitrite reductase membrane component NrfD
MMPDKADDRNAEAPKVEPALRRPARSKPDKEARLREIRCEAELRGRVEPHGARHGAASGAIAGAPFPVASAETGYYGTPLLKKSQWTMEIPAYFFVGGAAGAAAVIAAAGSLSGADEDLIRDARWLAAIGGAISPALLISDLGMPSRFLNMLRVFKIQSPMSVGSWSLVAFSNAAAASAFAGTLQHRYRRDGSGGMFRMIGSAAEAIAALTGLVLCTYTGVLLGATAVPVWNENAGTLPAHFAASGLGAAVSILELKGHASNRALNALGIAAAAAETLVGARVESRDKRSLRPLKHGHSGALIRLGGLLAGPLPLALRLLAGSPKKRHFNKSWPKNLRRIAALSTVAGSLLTRAAWLEAGKASQKDPASVLQLPASPGAAPIGAKG